MKLEKRTIQDISGIELPDYDFINDIISKASSDLNNQMDEITIEGLKRKGFEFENMIEMANFIKARCKIEDYNHKQQRIYFVDETPFLVHNYKTEIDFKDLKEDNRISAEYGSFAYL